MQTQVAIARADLATAAEAMADARRALWDARSWTSTTCR